MVSLRCPEVILSRAAYSLTDFISRKFFSRSFLKLCVIPTLGITVRPGEEEAAKILAACVSKSVIHAASAVFLSWFDEDASSRIDDIRELKTDSIACSSTSITGTVYELLKNGKESMNDP